MARKGGTILGGGIGGKTDEKGDEGKAQPDDTSEINGKARTSSDAPSHS